VRRAWDRILSRTDSLTPGPAARRARSPPLTRGLAHMGRPDAYLASAKAPASIFNSTLATAKLSEALPTTAITPLAVAPPAGAVRATVGGWLSQFLQRDFTCVVELGLAVLVRAPPPCPWIVIVDIELTAMTAAVSVEDIIRTHLVLVI
jgi:hypothetical protein